VAEGLNVIERRVLLRFRTAMRFRFDGHQPPPASPEEAAEEQAALPQRVSFLLVDRLTKAGLLEPAGGGTHRLTHAGLAALHESAPPVTRGRRSHAGLH